MSFPQYEGNKKYNSALDFFTNNHIGKKSGKSCFTFNKKKPLLPQIEKALAQVTKEDYCDYVQYLREDAQNIKHPLNEIANSKASNQENLVRYLYLLVSDSGVLLDYLKEGEEPPPTDENGKPVGISEEQRKNLMFSRMAKNGQLWEKLTEYAGILAGNFYKKTIQGEVLNDVDEIAGKNRENRRYKYNNLGGGITEYRFNSGVSILHKKPNKEIEAINNKISELPQNTSKVLRILRTNTADKVPSDVFKGGTLEEFINYTQVEISVDDYLKYTRKADRKNAKKALESALNDLYNLSIDKAGTFSRHRWITSLDTSRKRHGVYVVCFSPDIMGYICSTHTKIHDFNMILLTLSENKRLAYQLGRKLWVHYVASQGEQGSNRLLIGMLLDILTELPRVADIRGHETGRLSQRIREPFEMALGDLVSIGYLNGWKYTKAKGENVPEDEQKQATFEDWLGWYLEYDLNLPPQDKYINQRHKMQARRKKRAENARKANEAKQEKKLAKVHKG
jgi:hypothetical protein